MHAGGKEQRGPLPLHGHHQDRLKVARQQEGVQAGYGCRRSGH